MNEQNRFPGQTTIAPEVLLDIVRLSVLSVEGVSRLADTPGEINRFFSKATGEGVHIIIEGDVVNTAVYVVLKPDYEVLNVSHAIQAKVGRSISEMVGMTAGSIDVHIEDIDCGIPKKL